MVSSTFQPSPYRPPVRARAYIGSKCNMNAARSTRLGDIVRCVSLCALFIAALPIRAAAQQDVATFFGGAATALAAHEMGHVITDVAFGVSPGLEKVSFAGIPFFAITHDPVTPTREFTISSAGFWVQHATDEVLLSRMPNLRDRHAPFLKGMFAFNVLASVGYSFAAFARVGPIERDTRGMAASANVREPIIGALILAPALFDGWRYFDPRAPLPRWGSRASKIAGVLLVIRASRQ